MSQKLIYTVIGLQKRGAPIIAEYLGGATNCDAYHMTDPRADGLGVSTCIELALKNSQIQKEQVGAAALRDFRATHEHHQSASNATCPHLCNPLRSPCNSSLKRPMPNPRMFDFRVQRKVCRPADSLSAVGW